MYDDKVRIFTRRIVEDGYAAYHKSEYAVWHGDYGTRDMLVTDAVLGSHKERTWDPKLYLSRYFVRTLENELKAKRYSELIAWLLSAPVPHIGLRAWTIIEDLSDRPRLRAVANPMWIWDAVCQAQCDQGCNIVPSRDCRCGLYAITDVEYAHDLSLEYEVFGLIAPWGRILEHERGYRAEHARILILFCHSTYSIQDVYRACPEVPIVTVESALQAMECGFTPEEVWPQCF